jgi:hypothetical protein
MPKGSKIPLVAEIWLFPDNTSVLELSTKCAPGQGMKIASELRSYLNMKAVPLDGEQSTKTKKALEYFSAQLVAR